MAEAFWRAPSDKELAQYKGAKSSRDFPEPVVEVWAENWDAVIWFRQLMTQFNYSAHGATGFNYAIAYRDFDDMGLVGVERDTWKWKLRQMEAEALEHINKPSA